MPEPAVTRQDLKRVEDRVEFVAQDLDGEKLVSRYILQQARQNGDDLAVVKARVERIEGKVDRLEQKVDRLEAKLPGLIAEVVREVLRESRS
jgi:ubiquinone biosynthesis protein UbiJ